MNRLDRYIAREMVVPLLIGTMAIVMMFQANSYIYLAKTFNVENIPLTARFQWILYMTPGYLELTMPAGTALGAALMMTRFARDSELTAVRAAGTRILRVIMPVFAFGLFMGALNYYDVNYVVPVASRKANEIAAKNGILGMTNTFKANALIQLDRFAASFGSVTRSPNDVLSINDVMLIERTESNVTSLITAPTGTYDRGVWRFPAATYYRVQGAEVTTAADAHREVVIDQEASLDSLFKSGLGSEGSTEQMPTPELYRSIVAARKAHMSSRPMEVELNTRLAVPASCAVFAITSAVFAVFFARSGGFVGVLVSFVIVLLYYNAFIISTQILGKMESVPSWLAVWLPNLLFGVIGLIAIRRLE